MYVASAFRRTVRAVRLKPDTTYYTVVKSAVGVACARQGRPTRLAFTMPTVGVRFSVWSFTGAA